MDLRDYLRERIDTNNVAFSELQRVEQYMYYYSMLYDKWKNIAINLFKWEGLPDGLTSRILEEQLFDKGMLAFVDGSIGKVILPMSKGSQRNVYNEPVEVSVYGLNYQETFKKDDFVIIRSSYTGKALSEFIAHYCYKLTDIDFTIRTQLNSHKLPFILYGDKNSQKTLQQYFDAITSFKPALVIDKDKMSEDKLTFVNTETTYIAGDLFNLYKSYEGEILTHLGINNNPIEKKERLVTDEVNANNQVINYHLQLMLKPRQEAVNDINKRFNTNISVEVDEQFIEKITESNMTANNEPQTDDGGDDNENN